MQIDFQNNIFNEKIRELDKDITDLNIKKERCIEFV